MSGWGWVFVVCGGIAGFLVVLPMVTERESRVVSPEVQKQLESIPTTRPNQHKVIAKLRDGREIRNVYIGLGRYVNYSFGFRKPLKPGDIVSVRRTPRRS